MKCDLLTRYSIPNEGSVSRGQNNCNLNVFFKANLVSTYAKADDEGGHELIDSHVTVYPTIQA